MIGQGPRVGLMLPSIPFHESGAQNKERIINAARTAEVAGFDSIYIGDHLLHANPLVESIVTLSLVAAVTDRITIGTCVLLIALREPLWLAKQLGTLDHYAPGRLRIGIGVGGAFPAEFLSTGVSLAERGRRTEDVLQQVRDALAGRLPAVDDGGVGVRLQPVPQDPVPFFFGGREERALDRAARLGEGWVGHLLTPEEFGERRSLLLKAQGSKAKSFRFGMLLHVQPDSRLDRAHERAAANLARVRGKAQPFTQPEKIYIAGPPDAMAEQLSAFWKAGCDELILAPADQGEHYLDQVGMLANDLLPQIRRFA
jgi:alkanesulfonate monooxygenase SsuD/methylene tetrahydromethanopterin reductase-like flavin-dependent oxidoreductase (luciferase family)